MRVSYQWLQDYIDPGLSAGQLAEKMTLSGIEVGAVERFGPDMPGVVAGEIVKLEPHPGRSNLTLCDVQIGKNQILHIVCGARNMVVGDKVVTATPGSTLPGPRAIEEAVLYGVKSEGMLCSASELGLELGAEDEILILDQQVLPGEPVDRLLGFDDYILHLELTPNRSDCLGMINVAYEVAALTGRTVNLPAVLPQEVGEPAEERALIKVEDPALCPRYTARVVDDIKIGRSPLWLQLRLLKAGIRPISNVVDITNYVMWEYGQPLHAFDLDLIRNKEIIVRRAKTGEDLVTLDGVKRKLDSDVLVIADHKEPIGLAGVMGGETTEINEQTKTVLVEAAAFDPTSIRRTARKFTLPSEASQRFERGVDHQAVLDAQNRAALLLAELVDGRVLSGVIDVNHSQVKPVVVSVNPDRINKILGMKIEREIITDILTRLQFEYVDRDDSLEITIPLRRPDITIEEDIVEEVARLNGYDKIPTTLPAGALIENRETAEERLLADIKNLFVSCGFFECISYSFINPEGLQNLRLAEDDLRLQAIPVKNPFSEEQAIMRTSIIPGLLKIVQHNLNHRQLNQLLFEIGVVYEATGLPLKDLPEEKLRICLAVTGDSPEPNWVTPARKADFFLIKGVLETLFRRCQINDVRFIPEAEPFTHPTRSASVFLGGEKLGFIGQLHPDIAATWNIDQAVTVCELDFSILSGRANLVPRVQAIPRFPAAIRDLALLVPRELSAYELEQVICEAGAGIIEQISLFDLYEGKQVPEGKRSLAYSITFRGEEKTLTDAEVNKVLQQIEKTLTELGVTLRS